MKKHILIAFVSVLVTFASCTKESKLGPRGEKGETGLDGKDGVDGIDGQDGQDGQDGKDGVANLFIYNFSVPDSAWVDSGTAFTTGAYSTYLYENSEITASMISNGTVMVYQDLANDFTTPLPRTVYLSGIQAQLSFVAGTGQIRLFLFANDNGHHTPEENPANFRVAFIPKTAKMLYPDLDFKNYDSVKEVFNIKD
jgi:hypothetical protein